MLWRVITERSLAWRWTPRRLVMAPLGLLTSPTRPHDPLSKPAKQTTRLLKGSGSSVPSNLPLRPRPMQVAVVVCSGVLPYHKGSK